MIVSPSRPRLLYRRQVSAAFVAVFVLMAGGNSADAQDQASPKQLNPSALGQTALPTSPSEENLVRGISPEALPEAPQALAAPTALAPPRMLAPAQRSKPLTSTNTNAQSLEATPGRRFEPGVQIDALDRVDPETLGTLGPSNGGFGLNMWQGTERSYVEKMLVHLPVKAPSPVMRGLMRRLLLSAAIPPQSSTPAADGANVVKESLISKRIRLLAGMGDFAGVGDMLSAIPGNVSDPDLLLVQADARFLANDNARACGIAARQILTNDGPYWQRAMIFCQILAGDPGKAELGLTMMNELGAKAPEFFSLADKLLGGAGGSLQTLAGADGLLLAMARAAKMALPIDAGKSDRPGILRAIAVNPNVEVDLRLDAAERAEAAGALDTKALRQLYSSVQFEAGDLSRPLSRAQEIGGPVSRALLYHSALSQSIPTAQAEIISRALEIAVADGRYGAAARVFQPVVAKMPPSAALLWFAPNAVRLMLSANDPEGAKSWFRLMQASALFHENSADQLVKLTPLVRLVGTMGLENEPRDLAAWWQAINQEPGAAGKAALLYGLLAGLGDDIPLTAWRSVDAIRKQPNGADVAHTPTSAPVHPALLFRLHEVTAEIRRQMAEREAQVSQGAENPSETAVGTVETANIAVNDVAPVVADIPPAVEPILSYKGEILLMALDALGDQGPAGADTHTLKQVVDSLRAIGLDDEARALALEAALAAGL